MKIGVLYFVHNPDWWHRPYPEVYARTLEHMQAMEDLGFDSINMTEFHFGMSNNGTGSPLVWNAAVAVKTRRVMIGQGITILPYANPVKLAEDMATIDNLSNGRFWLGAGEGARRDAFDSFGIDLGHRAGLTGEGMEVIRKCWTEEAFSYEGRHYTLKNVRMVQKPAQKPHPPMFLSAMIPGMKPMERTIELGFHAITGHGLDYRGEAGWEEWWAGWIEALHRHGKTPAQFQTAAMTTLFVSEDPERAWGHYRENPTPARRLQGEDAYGRPPSLRPPPQEPQNPFKTPDDAAKFLRNKYGKHPPNHLMLHADHAGMPPAESYECQRLFMNKVMPKLRDLTQQP